MKINYVAGFLFNNSGTEVALIRKNRPEWQAGFLNGIGGKVEEEERFPEAMVREFKEETDLDSEEEDWTNVAKIVDENKKWEVYFYKMFSMHDSLIGVLKSVTDEQIEIIDIENLEQTNVIPNLKWLIKMCLDKQIVGNSKIIYKS